MGTDSQGLWEECGVCGQPLVHSHGFLTHDGLRWSGPAFSHLKSEPHQLKKKMFKTLEMASFNEAVAALVASGATPLSASRSPGRIPTFTRWGGSHFSCKTVDSGIKAHPAFVSHVHISHHLYSPESSPGPTCHRRRPRRVEAIRLKDSQTVIPA